MRWLRGLRRIAPLPVAAGAAAAAVGCVGLFFVSSLLAAGTVPAGIRDTDLATMDLNFLAGGPSGVLDTDLDGVSDAVETLVLGSDPTRWNTTQTPVPDGWLAKHGYDPSRPGMGHVPAASPPAGDLPKGYGNAWPAANVATLAQVYAFGRPADWDEETQGPFDNGLDPRDWDQDDDGIPDGWLLRHGIDPRTAGVAALRLGGEAGLTVREAFEHATDPRRSDTDGDDLPDRAEIDGAPNPNGNPARFPPTDPARRDTLGTGVCDGFLVAHGLDPTKSTSLTGDPDRDGATTEQEANWTRTHRPSHPCGRGGLDPGKASSGLSALPDGWLIRFGLDPFLAGVDANVTQTAMTDLRPTGSPVPGSPVSLRVVDEYTLGRPTAWSETLQGPWWGGSDPAAPDTDGDALGDAYEVAGFAVSASTRPGSLPAPYIAHAKPTSPDGDGDGLQDGAEALRGIDPLREDTDFDGLADGTEVLFGNGLVPTLADSAGDLLRDGERLRLLKDSVAQYMADPSYAYGGEPGSDRQVTDWLAAMPGALDLGRALVPGDIANLLGPLGDLDGDGDLNLVDQDIDNDTLWNGWELHPELYAQSDHGAGDLPQGRPPSDPFNPDTDGDGLPDPWEIENALATTKWSLDPGDWDSDGDGDSDAVEDPDNDGTAWVAFTAVGVRVVTDYVHNNLEEFRAGTDPNNPTTDGDGLLDGWKVFWAMKYPTLGLGTSPSAGIYRPSPDAQVTIPADARRPIPRQSQLASSDLAVIREEAYVRLVADPTKKLAWETASGGPVAGNGISVQPLLGTLRFTLQDAQRAGTNPYLADTDGDGMPDWWEDLHASVLPDSAAGWAAAGCGPGPGPEPTIPDDPEQDADGDRLGALAEFEAPSDPHCRDSDLGGVPDGAELPALDPSDPADDAGLQQVDSDDDGVLDFDEVRGRTLTVRGVARLVLTNAEDPDSDADGLLDGGPVGPLSANDPVALRFVALGAAYLLNSDGTYTFPGERNAETQTDPSDADDSRAGVPAGWLWTHGQPMSSPSVTVAQAYRLGRPSWWSEPDHGVWWGGANPASGELAGLSNKRDLDGDLLADRDANGDPMEDAMPGANQPNLLRSVAWEAMGVPAPARLDPTDAVAAPMQRRLLGQAYMNPAPSGASHTVPHPTATADGRTPTCLQGAVIPMEVRKGTAFIVSGRLAKDCANSAQGVGGVAVEVRLEGLAFGANVTRTDGSFAIEANLTYDHALEVPAGTVYRGTNGTVAWRTDAAAVAVGSRTLAVGGYGTQATAPPAQVQQQVLVKAGSVLSLQVPEGAVAGQPVGAFVRLTDTAGGPLRHPVTLSWDGTDLQPLVLDADGSATVVLPAVPPARAGAVALEAVSSPPGTDTQPGEASAVVQVRRTGVIELQAPPSADADGQIKITGTFLSVLSPTSRRGEPDVPVTINLTLAGNRVEGTQLTTGANGRFAATLHVPADVPPGPADIVAHAQVTPRVSAASLEARMTLRARPAFVEVDLADLHVGSPAHVQGRLVEPACVPAACTPIAQAIVHVALGGTVATLVTDADGWFEAELAAPVQHGLLRQGLAFAGDDGHAPRSHAADRSALAGTDLAAPGGYLVRGDAAHLSARLTDQAGAPVAAAPLRFVWGASAAVVVVTGMDGVASLVHSTSEADPLGPVPVVVTYAAAQGSGLAAAVATATWEVRSPLVIELPTAPVVLGGPAPVGVLKNPSTGVSLASATVDVYVAGLGGVSRRTDEAGRFQILTATTASQAPASIDVVAIHRGTPMQGEAFAHTTLRLVSPVNASLHGPSTLVSGDEALIAVDLVDGMGALPDTGEVVVEAAGTVLARIDVAQGPARAIVRLPPGLAAGPVTMRATYSGSVSHAPAQAEAMVTVLSRVDIRLESKAVPPGATAAIEAFVSQDDEPLAGRLVMLRMEGMAEGFSAVTDREGRAVFHVTQGPEARHLAARVDAADGTSGASVLAVVTPMHPAAAHDKGWLVPTFVAAGVLLVGLGVAGFAFALRRNPLATPMLHARRAIAGHGPFGRRIVAAYRALEDAAIALELLATPAPTPRLLQDAVAQALPGQARPHLERLLQIFEEARYGGREATPAQAAKALTALDDILKVLRRRALVGWSLPEAEP